MTELLSGAATAAPESEGLREAVGGVWRAVLGVESVGAQDDFFLSGGDSALAVETAISLRALTGTELDLDVLYQYSEFGKLLAFLTQPRSEREQRPLTPAEERLWFAERLHPGTPQYHIAALYRFPGRLDVLRLRTALDAVAARHDALRRGFEAPARAITAPKASVSCRWLDLRGLPESTLRQLIDEHARRPFDLASPPLLRALVVDCGDEGDLLLLTVHHLVCDGASLAILEDDLGRLYTNGVSEPENAPDVDNRPIKGSLSATSPNGSTSSTPSMSAPSSTYSSSSSLGLFDQEQSRAYWRRTLAGCPRGIALPHDLPRPAVLDNTGDVHPLTAGADLLADMADLAASERLSPFMTWIVAYASGLLALTGERDMVIGIAASSRTAEQRGEIGMFVDPVPLRLLIPHGTTTRDLARQVRRSTTEVLAHRSVPFQTIVEELGPGGDPSRASLVQAGLTYLDASASALRLDGLEARRELLPTGTSKYELLWSVTRQAERTITEFEYLSALFSPEKAADVHADLIAAARAAFARPDAPLRTPDAAADSSVSGNRSPFGGATAVTGSRTRRPLPELFRQHVEQQPDAPAVRHRGVELTYRQLHDRALAVAAGLRAAGLRRGGVVAVPMPRGIDAISAYLGIHYAGCAYLPLDPDQPADRVRTAVHGVADAALVTGPSPLLPADLPVLQIEQLLDDADCADTTGLPVRITGEDPAYLMSTSGSTGRPKTVVVPHRGISRLVPEAAGLVMHAEDRVAHVCNPMFDAAVLEIWGALGAGGLLVIGDKQDVLSPVRLRAFLGEHRISVLGLPTALLHTVIDFAPDTFSGVRLLMFGGEKADDRRLARLMAHQPPERVVNIYGPTENTTVSTLQRVTTAALDPGPLPIGRAVSGSTAYALGPGGEPVAPGEEGELYVGGDGLALGYHGNPALTAASFVPDPFDRRRGARLYRTGDRVRLQLDGTFQFVGRNDDQVKVRGFRVELGEIEHALRSLPGVTDAVAFARATPDGAELLACVTGGARMAGPAELTEDLRRRLPHYMIPALVVTDRLPLNANGKVDRAALLASLPSGAATATPAATASGSGSESGSDDASEFGSADPIAEAVSALWCESLGLERARPDDSFVALGGHSIKALKLLARVDETLGVAVDLADFLAEPTLRGLVTTVSTLIDE